MSRVCWVRGLAAGLLVQVGGMAMAQAAEPSAGTRVTVAIENANLMRGSHVVGALDKGLDFEVTRVIDGWLGAVIERDGQQLKGWVWHKHVSPAADSAPASPVARSEEWPVRAYRPLSYEPATGSALSEQMAPRRGSGRLTPPEKRLRPGSGR